MRIKLFNGRFLDGRGEQGDCLYLENGLIAKEGPADEVIDCRGLVVMPAFIDMHTHLRDPGWPEKETIETGMRAALHGGYGTLCAMANTNPVCATPELVEENHRIAKELNLCHLIQSGAAGEELNDGIPTDRAALSKVTKVLTNDGKTIFSDSFMEQLMVDSEEYGFIISTHSQPERQIVARDIELLKKVGGNLHVGHISHRETAAMIREAKKQGLPITCEVTPHHLFGWDCDYRVNPPLRSRADVEALIQGCKDGTVDCLSTDHAPHTPEAKAAGMAGISNIDYALSVYWKVFSENGLTLQDLTRMGAMRPAQLLGLPQGLLEIGRPADLMAFDPEEIWNIREEDLFSRSHNTPFLGREVKGRVHWTMIGGEMRYEYHG
ncbi:MAG: dihydroorotase [Clostridia bacterium]|nr:dihydroorotase [Clostridia bacterium]